MIQPSIADKLHQVKPSLNFQRWVRIPRLTKARIIAAFVVALAADGLQIILGPLGMVGPVQAIDVVAMIIETWLIGFHWLLLPTFALEFIPVADVLPTWTGCVAIVIFRRRREQARNPPPIEIDAAVSVGRLPAKPSTPPRILE